MQNNNDHFFKNEKICQFSVQFGCRIPIRREFTDAEKMALKNGLVDLDSEVFQLFDEPLQKSSSCLFQVLRQLIIGPNTTTFPSFILSNDSFSFFLPIKVSGKEIKEHDNNRNKKICQWVFKVQEIIRNSQCQRTGKIYELVLGPFEEKDKTQVFQNLFSADFNDIGELSLSFAKYHKENADIYNVQTNVHYLQQNIADPFFITVRVDINNRNLSRSMEPSEIEKVWNFSDSIIDNHLKKVLLLQ